MSRRLAWVTGAQGLIGRQFVRIAPQFAPDWEVRGLAREDFDLVDFDSVTRTFASDKPSLVIHCAAMSRGPACEAEPARARRCNVEATAHLARLAEGVPLFFFSTDLVFDGTKGNYAETDAVNPLSFYALTKAEAERIVLQNPRHTVIRTSLNGGTTPTGFRGFNEELRRAWREGRAPRLFADEFRSPMAALVTARAVWELAARSAAGIFHIAGSERLSRWEIGGLVAKRCPELQPRIEAESLLSHTGPPRAPDTSLDCAKAQAFLSFRLPGLAAWLRENPHEPF